MMQASVVIATKNRRDEVYVALRSALSQVAAPEIIVMDDASTDGTFEMVRREFPTVRSYRSETSLGCSAQRNRGVRLASNNIVFSLDDDAVFTSPKIIGQTLQEFSDARIAAIAMPFVNVKTGPNILCKAPDETQVWITHSFVGAAAALRRDVFLEVGGYREHWDQYGEEGDLGVRFLNAGYFTRLGNADPIHHFESPNRNYYRRDVLGRRNDILFATENVPMPWLLVHLPATTVNGLISGLRYGRSWNMIQGTFAGYVDGWRHRRERAPVSARAYLLHRRLKKHGPLALREIEGL